MKSVFNFTTPSEALDTNLGKINCSNEKALILDKLSKILDKNSVHHEELGIIIEKEIIINEKTKVTIDEIKSYNTNWLTEYMSS